MYDYYVTLTDAPNENVNLIMKANQSCAEYVEVQPEIIEFPKVGGNQAQQTCIQVTFKAKSCCFLKRQRGKLWANK